MLVSVIARTANYNNCKSRWRTRRVTIKTCVGRKKAEWKWQMQNEGCDLWAFESREPMQVVLSCLSLSLRSCLSIFSLPDSPWFFLSRGWWRSVLHKQSWCRSSWPSCVYKKHRMGALCAFSIRRGSRWRWCWQMKQRSIDCMPNYLHRKHNKG